MIDRNDEITLVRRERDLYLRLLNLGQATDPEAFLRDALGLIAEVTEAQQGYLELHDDDAPNARRWWIAHGFSGDEVETVRTAISRGVIAEALATGRTITTASALSDPRFKDRDSVRQARIEAVLCAPIGQDLPRGILYLQGRVRGGSFSDADRLRAETFAHHLRPLADKLLAEHHRERASDPLETLRRTLRLDGGVGRGAAWAGVLQQAALVAPLDVNVLLTGDSGTGKSLLAQVIHQSSPRATHPFVEVNCGALPESLVESELFGALPGAHSTAVHRVEGKVTAAEHGTLFLDEIGVLPLTTQVKLLQLLQSKQYYPLGAPKPTRADVRIIAATNLDLERAVSEGKFREDLFYRLHVLPLRVPSLAERREDIPELGRLFCRTACERHGLGFLKLSSNVLRMLESAEWPGNIRQLAHAVEAAAIRAAGGGALQIETAHFFPGREGASTTRDGEAVTFQEATRRFQAELLRATLEEMDWNVVETARRLDMARSYLYKLLRAYGLERTRS